MNLLNNFLKNKCDKCKAGDWSRKKNIIELSNKMSI